MMYPIKFVTSEVPVLTTDDVSTEDIVKRYTTLAMDYGSLVINDYQIHLFDTPGQDRFDGLNPRDHNQALTPDPF